MSNNHKRERKGRKNREGRKREGEKETENNATCIKSHGRHLFYRLCSEKEVRNK